MVMNLIFFLFFRINKLYIVICNISMDMVLGDGGWWVLNLCVCLCLMLFFGMLVQLKYVYIVVIFFRDQGFRLFVWNVCYIIRQIQDVFFKIVYIKFENFLELNYLRMDEEYVVVD